MSCKLWSLVCFFSITSQWQLQINYLSYHLVHFFQFFFLKKIQLKSGHLGVHINLCIHMHWRLSQMSILWYEPLTYEQGLEMNREYIKVLSSKEGNRNLPKPPKVTLNKNDDWNARDIMPSWFHFHLYLLQIRAFDLNSCLH